MVATLGSTLYTHMCPVCNAPMARAGGGWTRAGLPSSRSDHVCNPQPLCAENDCYQLAVLCEQHRAAETGVSDWTAARRAVNYIRQALWIPAPGEADQRIVFLGASQRRPMLHLKPCVVLGCGGTSENEKGYCAEHRVLADVVSNGTMARLLCVLGERHDLLAAVCRMADKIVRLHQQIAPPIKPVRDRYARFRGLLEDGEAP